MISHTKRDECLQEDQIHDLELSILQYYCATTSLKIKFKFRSYSIFGQDPGQVKYPKKFAFAFE